jgi:hypothetical protein
LFWRSASASKCGNERTDTIMIQSMKNDIQKLTSDNQELSSEIKKLKFENIV